MEVEIHAVDAHTMSYATIVLTCRTPPMNPPIVAPTVSLTQSEIAKYWGEMEGMFNCSVR